MMLSIRNRERKLTTDGRTLSEFDRAFSQVLTGLRGVTFTKRVYTRSAFYWIQWRHGAKSRIQVDVID